VTRPVLQAILVADHVYQDKFTGKFVICGVFSKLFWVPAQPGLDKPGGKPPEQISVPMGGHRAGSPFAYFSLTDIHGTVNFEMRYVDLEDNDVLFKADFRVKCDDPLQTVEVVLPLPVLPVPAISPEESGHRVCALELLCDNDLLGAHRIKIEPAPSVQ
jgi:hypothetical protein